ncbi:M56 family metallopeptidase [Geothrix oryzisoli]|uniref:M56 family metallopeptidase n=1 Tax=Geothrix oryzisoli TaxID=2922721 RepID=UPI001FAC5984|nr:M56 family metallopeptidase [Geothrix oryzisoli]
MNPFPMDPLLSLVREPWARNLGWSLLHFLWQGAALGLLAWLLLALLRGASAKARYGAACALLLLMAAAPVVTFLLLQRQAPAPAEPLSLTVAALTGEPAGEAPLPLRMKAALDAALPWLLGTWALGVLLLSTRFLGSWIRVQRLRRRNSSPVPAEWHLVLSRLCRELRLSRTVRLLQSAAVEVPTALGWLRPIILLPACALTGLAPAQLEAVLAHELAHIRRGDFLVNLLQSLVEVVLFYHPAVWWLSARVRAERELCCDDAAAALCGDPLILARALTDLEALRDPDSPAPTHLALAANGGSLMHRVRHLLQPALPASNAARATALALLAASLLGAAGAVFQDKGKEPPTPKPDQNTRMKVIDGERQMDVQMKGEVKLDPAAKDPVVIPGDGSFRVEEKQGVKARTYTVTKDQRTYTVDGREQPLDAEGEAWVRGVVKDAAKATTAREKVRRVEIRTRHLGDHARGLDARARDLEARERELDAHTHDLEARTKDLEHRAQVLTPEEQTRLKADGERLKVEGERLKAEGERLKAEGVKLKAEAERFRNDPEMKALIAKAEQEGRRVRVEVLKQKDAEPDTLVIRRHEDGQEVVERRVKVLRKGGGNGEGPTWAVIGPGGEEVIVEGMDQAIPIPPQPMPRMRILPRGHRQGGDPQAEMAAIKAELKALQTRLDQLQKEMSTTPKPPKAPKVPTAPKPNSVPPPPPPPDAPPAPPAPPTPPAESGN